jgi:hypothetical protein
VRERLVRPQWVTVRKLISQAGDEFGDASVLVSETRSTGFRIKMQVTWLSRSPFENSAPGRSSDIKAYALVRHRDIPNGVTWTPNTNDLIETVGVAGETLSLFVMDIQPAFPKRISFANRSGGFSGWRLTLVDRDPTVSPATQYES